MTDVVEKVGDFECAALFLSHWLSDLTSVAGTAGSDRRL
jgi:hypothetical protein